MMKILDHSILGFEGLMGWSRIFLEDIGSSSIGYTIFKDLWHDVAYWLSTISVHHTMHSSHKPECSVHYYSHKRDKLDDGSVIPKPQGLNGSL
ncbi:hypothetical protein ACTXT7_010515 [Hymenolepis weldensis]